MNIDENLSHFSIKVKEVFIKEVLFEQVQFVNKGKDGHRCL